MDQRSGNKILFSYVIFKMKCHRLIYDGFIIHVCFPFRKGIHCASSNCVKTHPSTYNSVTFDLIHKFVTLNGIGLLLPLC